MRACYLLAVNLGCASSRPKLFKLAIEGLSHGADAGIADEAFFGISYGKRKPLIGQGQANFPKVFVLPENPKNRT